MLVSRTFDAVPPSDSAAAAFSDTVGDGADATEASALLRDLRARMRARVETVLEYAVPWRAGGLDPRQHTEHAACVFSLFRTRITAYYSDRVETGFLISYQDYHMLPLTLAGTAWA